MRKVLLHEGMEEDFLNPSFQSSEIKGVEFTNFNITNLVLQQNAGDEVNAVADPAYEQFLADVWVGIVLTLMVLSCVCFMCSCLIYHKFQEWKHRVIEARNAANLETGTIETELPSYTIASGLPTYEEALEQLKKVKELNISCAAKTTETLPNNSETSDSWVPHTPPTPALNTLSVLNLFQIYSRNNESMNCSSKPT